MELLLQNLKFTSQTICGEELKKSYVFIVANITLASSLNLYNKTKTLSKPLTSYERWWSFTNNISKTSRYRAMSYVLGFMIENFLSKVIALKSVPQSTGFWLLKQFSTTFSLNLFLSCATQSLKIMLFLHKKCK